MKILLMIIALMAKQEIKAIEPETKLRRASSVGELKRTKFKLWGFKGEWKETVGDPQINLPWIVYAGVGSGKTTGVAMICKQFSQFGRVAYNPLEEGLTESIKQAMIRVDVPKNVKLLHKELTGDIYKRLSAHKAPNIMVIDSVQYLDIYKVSEYLNLLRTFPNTQFVFVSHIDEKTKEPMGSLAKFIYKDAFVKLYIEGYKIFPKSRFGGNKPMYIWEEEAKAYWAEQLNKKSNESNSKNIHR